MKYNLKVAKYKPNAILPSKREEDADYDIYACLADQEEIFIYPGETKFIPTGIITAFDSRWKAKIEERGSTAQYSISVRAGIIDSGYRGEWFVALTNHNAEKVIVISDYEVNAIDNNLVQYPIGKAIAQFAMIEVPEFKVQEISVNEIMAIASERGAGMLGSSGK